MAYMKYLKNIEIGSNVAVETADEILTGQLKLINLERGTIVLDNAREEKTGCTYTLPQWIALPDVKTIKVLQQENESEEVLSDEETSHSSKDVYHSTSSNSDCLEQQEQEALAVVQLSHTELTQIQEHLKNVTYIKQADFRYHKAIADIKLQSVIGLIMEPNNYGRHERTALLGIATPSNIYIFDISLLGQMLRELKAVLEANHPRKAVHYSHKMLDNLKRKHHIELRGIFDTFVAHCLLTGANKACSLEEALQQRLGLSKIFFDYEDENNLPFDPYRRPMSKNQLQFIAKRVLFQLKLHEHLLHEQMLKSFYQQCSNFSKTFCDSNDIVQVAMDMLSNNPATYENIQQNDEWRKPLNQTLHQQQK